MVKFSRSGVEKFLSCKRCFILQYKHKIRPPSLPFTLNNAVDNLIWNQLEEWVKINTKGYSEIFLLGTGGNINKLHKLANIKDNSPITLSAIKQIYYNLKKFNYEERIVKLGLNPDRSDVIIPATELFLKIFKWSGAKFIYVPRAGLSDGMIRELYKTKVESLKV